MTPSFLDYIYYRVAKVYFKWDGRTGATGIIAVSMIEIIALLNVIIFINYLIYDDQPNPNAGVWVCIYVLVGFFVILMNYRKYDGKYNQLKRHWVSEPARLREIKGLLVIVALLLPWLPLFVFWFYMIRQLLPSGYPLVPYLGGQVGWASGE